MEGSPEVRRLFSIAVDGLAADTPATRRHAPRTASVIFIMCVLCSNFSAGTVDQSSTVGMWRGRPRPRNPTLRLRGAIPVVFYATEPCPGRSRRDGDVDFPVLPCALWG